MRTTTDPYSAASIANSGVYRDYIGIMEKNMETTIMGYIGDYIRVGLRFGV